MFIELMTDVTFLCPHKKVTKEGGIGEALCSALPRTETPSPMYPTRGALGICGTFRRRDGDRAATGRWRRLRSRRPAEFQKQKPCTAKIGTFLSCSGM